MKQALFLLLALAVTLGLLGQALQERTRLMEPVPEVELKFNNTKPEVTRWQPPLGQLNISQVTVEHQVPVYRLDDDGRTVVDTGRGLP